MISPFSCCFEHCSTKAAIIPAKKRKIVRRIHIDFSQKTEFASFDACQQGENMV
jgi:hypothetical protein